jgi:threonine dehydrogenase-like Zn-dependent dehydrogenase
MGCMVRVSGPRIVELVEYQDPPLAPHEVRLHTLFSGISAGTELAAYHGSHPQLSKHWDTARRLFTQRATVMGLAARRQLDLGPLVSHVISVGEAASAFAILDRQPDQALQILLNFSTGKGLRPCDSPVRNS